MSWFSITTTGGDCTTGNGINTTYTLHLSDNFLFVMMTISALLLTAAYFFYRGVKR